MSIDTSKGHCKHGEFNISSGCPQCIAERRAAEESRFQIVKVNLLKEGGEVMSYREYTYYSVDRLKVGDEVAVPVRSGFCMAKVTAVDVPVTEIAAFKDKVKTIASSSKAMLNYLSKDGHQFSAPPSLSEEAREVITAGRDEMIKDATAAIPEAKPGDDWLNIKPLGPLTDSRTPSEKLADGLPAGGLAEAAAAAGAEVHVVDMKMEMESNYEGVLIRVAPEKDGAVQALYNEGAKLEKFARARVIATADDLKPLTNDLAIISKLKKALEEKKKEYTGPIKAHLDDFNAKFAQFIAPLLEADRINRAKAKAYDDAIKARRAEAEAIEVDKRALAEREAKHNAGEFTVDLGTTIAPPAAPERTHTEMGTLGKQTVYRWELTDLAQVPAAYMKLNEAAITAAVRSSKGTIIIPGIRVIIDSTIKVTTR